MWRLVPVMLLGCSDEKSGDAESGGAFPEPDSTPVEDSRDDSGDKGDSEKVDDSATSTESSPDDSGDTGPALPKTCALSAPVAEPVGIDPVCGSPRAPDPVEDPWDVTVEWTWSALSTDASLSNVLSAPVVAQLTDDNADGRIDRLDRPDVVVLADDERGTSTIVVLDGATGEELATIVDDFADWASLAVADVDDDGRPEIVVPLGDGLGLDGHQMAAFSSGPDFALEWIADEPVDPPSFQPPIPLVADLDGNGSIEIVADRYVYDGASGALITELPTPPEPKGIPVLADVDLDGVSEIVWSQGSYDVVAAGFDADLDLTNEVYSAVVQGDDDPEAEVVMSSNWDGLVLLDDGALTVLDADQDPIGPLCAADFDGDGEMEVAAPTSSDGTFEGMELRMYELDGTLVWTAPIEEVSNGAAGCATADLDNDGAWEVLYADADDFHIYDGRTGDDLYDDPDHFSITILETPVVADVDQDGSAEVVFVSNYDSVAVTVLGHAGKGWAPAPAVWAVHDFDGTQVLDGGTVANRGLGFDRARVARGQPRPVDAQADLYVDEVETCVESCELDGVVQFALRLANRGGASATLPATVEVWAGAELLTSVPVEGEALESGWSREGFVVETTYEKVAEGLHALVLDDANECDEENDVTITIACP